MVSFLFSKRYVYFWALLLLWRLYFVLGMLFYRVPVLVLYNYFIYQEVLGLLFLINLRRIFPYLLLMAKVGVSPFHVWGFYLLDYLGGPLFIWFIVYQKVVILPLLVFVLLLRHGLVILGLLGLYCSMVGTLSLKSLVYISATESLRWLLLVGVFCTIDFYMLSFFYFVVRYYFVSSSYKRTWSRLILVLILFSLPFTLRFFIKFFVLCAASSIVFYIVLILFPLSLLRIGYLFLTLFTSSLYYSGSSRIYSFLRVILVVLLFSERTTNS